MTKANEVSQKSEGGSSEPTTKTPDTRHRAYLLTINDPKNKEGCSHEELKEKIMLFNPIYYAMADEIGLKSKLYHTHIYFVANSGMRFSTVKARFPYARIDPAYGSAAQNVAYLTKSGIWENSEKKETSVEGTFEEWGEMPRTAKETRDLLAAIVLEELEAGTRPIQIIRENPTLWKYRDRLHGLAYDFAVEKYGEVLRDVTVTYIWGDTNVGKTSFVFNQFGYANVFHMYNYKQKNAIWDGYDSTRHDTVLIDEFLGSRSLDLTDLNIYLAPFPVVNATARFQNKVLTAKRIFIVSNLSWSEMFAYERDFETKVYNAFARRVHNIWEMKREPDSDVLTIIQHKQTKDIPDLVLNDKIQIIKSDERSSYDAGLPF